MIVESAMGLSPFSQELFVFCNRHCHKLKVLYWDHTGFALWYKCLEKNTFTWLCKVRDKHFGVSSEKSSPDQLGLFNETESALDAGADEQRDQADVNVAAHTRQKKHRVSIPDDLPREEMIYGLADSDKVCPHDGNKLKPIGRDDHEQLDIILAQVKVIRHKRLKYACLCYDGHIATASKPKQPIEKSMAIVGLLAFVVTQKYCDALPLYRQSEMFKCIDIEPDRRNFTN